MAVLQEQLVAPPTRARALPFGDGTRRMGVGLAAAGWAALVLMWATGSAEAFGHDQVGLPATAALGLFLVGWVVMVAAMMLPSSLPTLRLVDRAADPRASRFMAGYFTAWAAFGAAAFAADQLLHLVAANMSLLTERPSLIGGGVAMFAGAAELLGRTRPPGFPKVPEGSGSLTVGRAHAIDRIRRCWPLMLFAMAVGMSSPMWMVLLTGVMTLELRPRAHLALRVIGAGLLVLGVAVIVQPEWMPLLFGTFPEA